MDDLSARIQKRKESQARAHKKWRESERGKAYYEKRRLIKSQQQKPNETPGSGST